MRTFDDSPNTKLLSTRLYCVSAIYTSEYEFANTLLVEGNIVSWIGDSRTADRLFPNIPRIYAPYHWISPGLVDSYAWFPHELMVNPNTGNTSVLIKDILDRYASHGIVSVHNHVYKYNEVQKLDTQTHMPKTSQEDLEYIHNLLYWIEYDHPVSRYMYIGDKERYKNLYPHNECIRGISYAISSETHYFSDNSVNQKNSVTEVTDNLIEATKKSIPTSYRISSSAHLDYYLQGLKNIQNIFSSALIASIGHRVELECWITEQQSGNLATYGIVVCLLPEKILTHRNVSSSELSHVAKVGLPIAVGSMQDPWHLDMWSMIAKVHKPPFALTSRSAFLGVTKGGYRAVGMYHNLGSLTVGAPATFVLWQIDKLFDHNDTAHQLARWSTDSRSRVSGLPDFSHVSPCAKHTVIDGKVVYDDL